MIKERNLRREVETIERELLVSRKCLSKAEVRYFLEFFSFSVMFTRLLLNLNNLLSIISV